MNTFQQHFNRVLEDFIMPNIFSDGGKVLLKQTQDTISENN